MTRARADEAEAGLPRRVAVIGCGLIGGSLALAAVRVAGVGAVVVTDANPGVIARARQLGVGTEVADRVEDAVEGAELVVLAVPPGVTSQCAAEVAGRMDMQSVLTDTASLKTKVVHEVESVLSGSVRFVGGHPMAGSERSGIDAADPRIFQGSPYLLTPTSRTDAGAVAVVSRFVRAIGAHVLVLDPETHDELVAAVSHLPQAIATSLAAYAADRGELLAAAGRAFREATRVASSDPELWTRILLDNGEAVLRAIDGFDARLGALRAALAAGDAGRVASALVAGRGLTLPGRRARVGEVALVVPLEDRPGRLAEVTAVLGGAGLNVEDVWMRHADAGGRGAAIFTLRDHEDAERAILTLDEQGIGAHVEESTGR